jgi:hypothetical protein
MVALGDYIGSILSELTIARVRSDIESIRVAELYSTNTILRNFAVPRVRFQDIEITAPIIIDKVAEPTRLILNITNVKSEVNKSTMFIMEKYQITSDDIISKIKNTIEEKSKTIEDYLNQKPSSDTFMIDTKFIADEYTNSINELLKKLKDSHPLLQRIDIAKLIKDLRIDLRTKLLRIRPAPSRLQVLVQSSQIKEMGLESTNIMKFKINEDAMEWTEFEAATGETKDQLVPE